MSDKVSKILESSSINITMVDTMIKLRHNKTGLMSASDYRMVYAKCVSGAASSVADLIVNGIDYVGTELAEDGTNLAVDETADKIKDIIIYNAGEDANGTNNASYMTVCFNGGTCVTADGAIIIPAKTFIHVKLVDTLFKNCHIKPQAAGMKYQVYAIVEDVA